MMEVCLVVGPADLQKQLAEEAEAVPWLAGALKAALELKSDSESICWGVLKQGVAD